MKIAMIILTLLNVLCVVLNIGISNYIGAVVNGTVAMMLITIVVYD